jgi:hypothetical protein
MAIDGNGACRRPKVEALARWLAARVDAWVPAPALVEIDEDDWRLDFLRQNVRHHGMISNAVDGRKTLESLIKRKT